MKQDRVLPENREYILFKKTISSNEKGFLNTEWVFDGKFDNAYLITLQKDDAVISRFYVSSLDLINCMLNDKGELLIFDQYNFKELTISIQAIIIGGYHVSKNQIEREIRRKTKIFRN